MNQIFQSRMRQESCYPAFRGFVTVATWLLYICAAFFAVWAIFAGGQTPDSTVALVTIVAGVGMAMVSMLLVTVLKEAVLMLADIADATIGTAARAYEVAQPNTGLPIPVVASEKPPAES